MTHGWIVFRRELDERWRVLPTALLLGLLPLAMRWLPVAHGLDPEDLRDATALALSSLFTLGVAVVLGSSMMARELGEKRLGFYYARPISAGALWSGKLAAALGLSVACWFLLWIPTWIDGGQPGRHLQEIERWLRYFDSNRVWLLGMGGSSVDSWWASAREQSSSWRPWWLSGLAVLGIVLASHFVTTALRSRSPWLLFDFGAAGLLAFALGITVQRLTAMVADPGLRMGIVGALVAFPLAAVIAGFAQARWGRTVPARAHVTLSLTLWGLLGLAVVLYSGWVWRSSASGPEDLEEVISFRLAGRGGWAVVAGEFDDGTGYQPTFAVGPKGALHILPAAPRLQEWPRFSPDNRWLTGSRCTVGRSSECELWALDLENGGPEKVLATAEDGVVTALGGDGMLGVLKEDRLELYDIAASRLLATYRVPEGFDQRWLRIDARGKPWVGLAAFRARDSFFEFWRLDASGESLERHFRLEGFVESLSPDWDRVAAHTKDGFEVWEVGTGEQLMALDRNILKIRAVRFLSGGRMAIRESGSVGEPPRAVVVSRDGTELSVFERGVSRWLLGGEPEPGKLLLGVGTLLDRGDDESRFLPTSWHRWETLLVDVETGAILQTFPDRYPSALGHPLGAPFPQILMNEDELPEILRPGAERLVPVDYGALGATTGLLP